MNPSERAFARCAVGFTLVEAMISLSIIMLLTSLALTTIAGARESGRRAVCLTNLRELGLAVRMYMDQESRGILPVEPSLHASRPDERLRALRGDLLNNVLRDWTGGLPISDGERYPFRSPVMCPSDNRFGTKYGFSYDYEVGAYLERWPDRRVDPDLAIEATRYYEHFPPPGLRLFSDADGFHPNSPPEMYGTNAVFFDGSVGWIHQYRRKF